MNIDGGDRLYLLHDNGVIVSKDWGGTGYLGVQGSLEVQGGITSGGRAVVTDVRVGIFNHEQASGDLGAGWYWLNGDLNKGANGNTSTWKSCVPCDMWDVYWGFKR